MRDALALQFRQAKIKAWHFVSDDRKLGFGSGLEVESGWIYSEDSPELKLCAVGLHGSRRAIDALRYAPGSYLCRVEMWGDVAEGNDKLVARHRQVIAVKDVSSELRLFACWCVRQNWHLLTDERSRRAVEVAESFAVGSATKEELNAARDAAGSAAGYAAGSAAGAAAWSAAGYAAWSAAGYAAGYAAKAAQADEFERRMCAVLGVVLTA